MLFTRGVFLKIWRSSKNYKHSVKCFRKSTSCNLHMWRQYSHSFVGINAIIGISPLNIAIAMAPVLSLKVSSCTSTSGVCQDTCRNAGARKPRIRQDNGSWPVVSDLSGSYQSANKCEHLASGFSTQSECNGSRPGAPLGDHDSVVLAWPLPVSIPASCFFDQEAVRDNSTSSFIRTAIFVPKHVTLSQKMRLALPANKLHC